MFLCRNTLKRYLTKTFHKPLKLLHDHSPQHSLYVLGNLDFLFISYFQPAYYKIKSTLVLYQKSKKMFYNYLFNYLTDFSDNNFVNKLKFTKSYFDVRLVNQTSYVAGATIKLLER